jgi:Family of unknown function (DUF5317)
MSRIFSLFRVTSLWILCLPTLAFYIGASSNQLVLWANDNKFPVKVNPVHLKKFIGEKTPEVLLDGTVMIDSTHCVMTSKTHLNLLADNWDFHDGIVSIGDEFVDLGTWLGAFCPFVWGFAVCRKLLSRT